MLLCCSARSQAHPPLSTQPGYVRVSKPGVPLEERGNLCNENRGLLPQINVIHFGELPGVFAPYY